MDYEGHEQVVRVIEESSVIEANPTNTGSNGNPRNAGSQGTLGHPQTNDKGILPSIITIVSEDEATLKESHNMNIQENEKSSSERERILSGHFLSQIDIYLDLRNRIGKSKVSRPNRKIKIETDLLDEIDELLNRS